VLEDFVREGVDAPALWRHSVEEAVGDLHDDAD
jgi:hypothetical protein